MFSYNNIIDKRPAPRARELLDVTLGPTPCGCSRRDVPALQQNGVDAFIVDHLLSDEECDDLIRRCDRVEWSFWKHQAAGATTEGLSLDTPLHGQSPPKTTADDDEADTFHRRQGGGTEGVAALSHNTAEATAATTAAAGAPPVRDSETAARNFRSADTIEVDVPTFVDGLWTRLRRYFTEETVDDPLSPGCIVFDEARDPANYERDCQGTWHAAGFSPDALFARYLDGGHFAPHVDGTSIVDFNQRTMYTILVYLNDCAHGGETRVLQGEQCANLHVDPLTGKVTGNGLHVIYDMKPAKGAAIVFKYNALHEGASVAPGSEKYIFRGDILFERRPRVHDAESDRAAFRCYQEARVKEATGDAMEAMRLFRRVRKLSDAVADVYGL